MSKQLCGSWSPARIKPWQYYKEIPSLDQSDKTTKASTLWLMLQPEPLGTYRLVRYRCSSTVFFITDTLHFPPILIQSLVFIFLPVLYSAGNRVCFIWLTSHSANSHRHQSAPGKALELGMVNNLLLPLQYQRGSLSRPGFLCRLIGEGNVITAWLKCFLKYGTWCFNPLLPWLAY